MKEDTLQKKKKDTIIFYSTGTPRPIELARSVIISPSLHDHRSARGELFTSTRCAGVRLFRLFSSFAAAASHNRRSKRQQENMDDDPEKPPCRRWQQRERDEFQDLQESVFVAFLFSRSPGPHTSIAGGSITGARAEPKARLFIAL